MYCSACGNQIKKGLNYCNSCGSRLVERVDEKNDSMYWNAYTALAFIGLGGIVAFIFLVKILLENKFPEAPMIMIVLAFLATVFGICYLLIQKSFERSEKLDPQIQDRFVAKVLGVADTNQLEEPKQEPASVVENTTRILDEVLVERK